MIKGLITGAISLAILFQGVQVPTHASAAVSCTVAGGKTGSLKYSGQVSGNSAKICGAALLQAVKKVTSPVITVKKPAVISKKKTPVKKKAATKTTTTTNKYANQFVVTPDRALISYLGAASLSIGQSATFDSIAVAHVRNRYLLGYPAQVSFVPISRSWSFGDGSVAAGISGTHSWSTPGTFSVKVTVLYSVKYRIIGRTGWLILPGTITSVSAPVVITITGDAAAPDPVANTLLVHWTCNQKQTAIGC